MTYSAYLLTTSTSPHKYLSSFIYQTPTYGLIILKALQGQVQAPSLSVVAMQSQERAPSLSPTDFRPQKAIPLTGPITPQGSYDHPTQFFNLTT